MSWTNTFTKEIVSALPAQIEIDGEMVNTDTLTSQQLKTAGWYELKPLNMGNEVINPQWQ